MKYSISVLVAAFWLLVLTGGAEASHQRFRWNVNPSASNIAKYNIYVCEKKPCEKELGRLEATVMTGQPLEVIVPHVSSLFYIVTAIDTSGGESPPAHSDAPVGIETAGTLPPLNPRIETGGDTTPPVVTFTAPANGATVSGANVVITVGCQDNSGSCASVAFSKTPVGGVGFPVTDATSPYGLTWDTTSGNPNGLYTLCALGADPTANPSLLSCITVTVNNGAADVTPPNSTITAPLTGATVSGTITLNGTATDNVAPSTAQWQIDGVNFGTAYGPGHVGPYPIDWNTAAASPGTHTITLLVTDGAGNSDPTPSSVSVTVANAGPPALLAPGIAQYPVFLDTTYSEPSGATVTVNSGDNLQAKLDAAACGSKLRLQAGITFAGPFTLRNKGCTAGNGIYITSANIGSLPAHNETTPTSANRIQTTHASNMPTIAGFPQVVFAEFGASNYRIAGVIIATTVASGGAYHNGSIVDIGVNPQNGTYPNADSLHPANIVLDRVWIKGKADANVQRGLALNCKNCAVINSRIDEIHYNGGDGGVGVGGWTGPGPIKINNNYISASGINILVGGANAWIEGLYQHDWDVRLNYVTKSPAWNPLLGGYVQPTGGHYTAKNLFETKDCDRCLIDSNIFENLWYYQSDQVYAQAILFSITQGTGGTVGMAHTVRNVTFQRNVVRNAGNMLNIRGYGFPATCCQSELFEIRQNIFSNINVMTANAQGRLGIFFQSTPKNISIEHNTFDNVNSATAFADGTGVSGVNFRSNIIHLGSGCNNSALAITSVGSCTTMLTGNFNTTNWTNNLMIGSGANQPGNNSYPADAAAVGFTNYAAGDYSLSAGSPYKLTGHDGADPGANYSATTAATAGVP